MKSEAADTRPLKLYVTGAAISSGDPTSWLHCGYTLVLAESPGQATIVAGDFSGDDSHEVKSDSPMILARVRCD